MVIFNNFYRFLLTGEISDNHRGINKSFVLSYLFLKIIVVFLFFMLKSLFCDSNAGLKNHVFEDDNVFRLLLNVVVLAPIFEEAIYRYHFNFSNKGVFISAIFACVLLYDELFLLLLILIYFTVLLFLINKKVKFNRLIIIYLSSLIFASSHLISYPKVLYDQNIVQIILVIAPHFIGGLLLSYVYFRNGIISAIAIHSFWNLIPFAVLLLKVIILGEI